MLLSKLREQRASVSQAIRVGDEPAWLNWGVPTASGVNIDDKAAMSCIPFVACVRAIGEPLGMLPRKIYEKTATGRREAEDHPLYPLLHDEPNPMMSSQVFFEGRIEAAVAQGNGIAWIEKDRANRIKGLWPLRSDCTTIEKKKGRLQYHVTTDEGGLETFDAEEVLHFPGMGFDGTRGYRPVQLMQEALGLAIAAERFGASFFGHGAHASGALQSPNTLSKPASDRLLKQIEERIGGIYNALRPLILEEGLVWNPLSVNPNDAQFLETRNFQAVELARWMRVPASEIDASGKDSLTYTTVEQNMLRFVTRTLMRWAKVVEGEINRKCFSTAQRGRFYMEHEFSALLRGDTKSRYEAHAVAGGRRPWKTPNEIRKDENMDPIAGGDDLAKTSLPDPNLPAPTAQTDPAAARSRIVESCRTLFKDAAERIVRREEKAFTAAWPKIDRDGARGLEAWGEPFYRGHEAYVASALVPPIAALSGCLGAAIDAQRTASEIAKRHVTNCKMTLATTLTGERRGPDGVSWKTRAAFIAGEEFQIVLNSLEEEAA